MTVLSDQITDTFYDEFKERAALYQKKGYSVWLSPEPDQLPDFLKEFPIHLLAKNGLENVVVEIRTLNLLKDDPYFQKLSEVIQDRRPEWRLELLMLKDKPVPLVDVDFASLLAEVESLQKLNYSRSAFLLVWSTLEIGLRNLAKKEDVPLEKDNAEFVIGKLGSWGWLEDDVYNTLGDALPVREAVAHGYKVSEDLAALVEKLLVIARTLV